MTESSNHNVAGAVEQSKTINPDSHVVDSEVEAELEAVAELVARVRHEINNPLAGVLGQAQLLLREDLNDKARKRAETIESLAMRLRDIVGQLRQVQRPGGDTACGKTPKEGTIKQLV